MNTLRVSPFPCLACCGLSLALATPTSAQIPLEHVVVATASGPRSSGTCGLFLVSLQGGARTRIGGLPAELQRPGGAGYQQGAYSIGIRGTDGALVVGTVSSAASPMQGRIELFVLHLSGTSVDPARTRRVLLGTTGSVGGASVATMPDGRTLVLASDAGGALTSGPMANHLAAIVDTSGPTPSFTLLPNPPVTGVSGGLAVDPTGRYAFFAHTVGPGSPSAVASLRRLDLATGQACDVSTWPGRWARGVACDDDGTVYVGLNDGATRAHSVEAVAVDGCSSSGAATPSSITLPPSGMAFDRGAARIVAATPGFAPGFPTTLFNSIAVIDRTTGAASILAAPPIGGWGLVHGAVVRNAMDSYGPASHGENRYWFENFPNPGGRPHRGNGSFSLTARTAPGLPLVSVLGLSLGRGSSAVPGIELLLDPGTTIVQSMPVAPSSAFALPIPNDPSLAGVEITAQTVHLESTGALAASRGATITVL